MIDIFSIQLSFIFFAWNKSHLFLTHGYFNVLLDGFATIWFKIFLNIENWSAFFYGDLSFYDFLNVLISI